jgi:hypothetical protein
VLRVRKVLKVTLARRAQLEHKGLSGLRVLLAHKAHKVQSV